jgi:hypothetical protein
VTRAQPEASPLPSVLGIEGNGPEPEADEAFGFTDQIREAFLLTADETDCVILTRVPGRHATGLIKGGQDLKSYFIKAKSCDWGPMAGFICRDPLLNKAGLAGFGFNAEEHRNYLNTLRRMQLDGTDPLAHPRQPTGDDQALRPYLEQAFLRLRITSERKWYVETYVLDRGLYDDRTGVGIALNHPDPRQATVAVEFAILLTGEAPIKPRTDLWNIVTGTVYVKADAGFRPQPRLTRDSLLQDVAPTDISDLMGTVAPGLESARAKMATLAAARGVPFAVSTTAPQDVEFRVVEGAQNPYPPYQRDVYKNAVAGDYDLFAVWPLTKGPVLRREAERRWTWRQHRQAPVQPPPPPPPSPWPLFLPVPDKPFTVESSVTRDLFIEFVPDFAEIAGLESDELGNVNAVVTDAVGLLNSFAATGYGDTVVRNIAFHSDEGGRPGVTEIEFEIGVFLPTRLRTVRRSFVLTKQDDDRSLQRERFRRLVDYLTGLCAVTLNAGWVHDMLRDPVADPLRRLLVPDLAGGTDQNSVTDTLELLFRLAGRTPADPAGPVPDDAAPWDELPDVGGGQPTLPARDRAVQALQLTVRAQAQAQAGRR